MQIRFLAFAVFLFSLPALSVSTAAPTMEIGPNNPASVQAGIEAAAAAGLAKVIVPPGVYHLSPRDGWHLRFKGLQESTDLELSGNEVEDPGPFLKHLVMATSSASGTGFESGFKTAVTSTTKK